MGQMRGANQPLDMKKRKNQPKYKGEFVGLQYLLGKGNLVPLNLRN